MNDNRDEIQRLRAMRAEAINRGDFGRADAIGADLARLESAAGGTIDPITGMPAASASVPSAPQGAPFPQRRDERPAQGRPAYEDQHGPAPRTASSSAPGASASRVAVSLRPVTVPSSNVASRLPLPTSTGRYTLPVE